MNRFEDNSDFFIEAQKYVPNPPEKAAICANCVAHTNLRLMTDPKLVRANKQRLAINNHALCGHTISIT